MTRNARVKSVMIFGPNIVASHRIQMPLGRLQRYETGAIISTRLVGIHLPNRQRYFVLLVGAKMVGSWYIKLNSAAVYQVPVHCVTLP